MRLDLLLSDLDFGRLQALCGQVGAKDVPAVVGRALSVLTLLAEIDQDMTEDDGADDEEELALLRGHLRTLSTYDVRKASQTIGIGPLVLRSGRRVRLLVEPEGVLAEGDLAELRTLRVLRGAKG